FGDARRFDDAQCLSRSRPSHLLGGEPRSLGTARLFLAALLVPTLLFFPPLGRAPLLLLAPSRGSPFLILTPLLLETHRVRDAGFVGGSARFLGCTRRGRGALHLLGRPLRVRCAVGSGRPRGFLRGPHRFLCRAGSFGGSFRLDRSICIGLLLREPLSFGDLPCLAGGARRLFGRALRLLRDASGLRSAIYLRGALRLESATRFLLGGARFIL